MQDEGTARALYLAQYINTPIYVVHVMSKGAAGEIAAAKLRGQRVIGETIASGIAAEEGKIWDPDFKASMKPSLERLTNGTGLCLTITWHPQCSMDFAHLPVILAD